MDLSAPAEPLNDWNPWWRLELQAPKKAMAPHSSTFAWRIPRTGKPGGLPSMGSHRVGDDWSDLAAERPGPGAQSCHSLFKYVMLWVLANISELLLFHLEKRKAMPSWKYVQRKSYILSSTQVPLRQKTFCFHITGLRENIRTSSVT